MSEVKGNPRDSGFERNANDWYVEPRLAIDMLLKVEVFDGWSHDPACGSGNIPTALKAHGYDCLASDIVDRGYPDMTGTADFLQTYRAVDNIVTNPPFDKAEKFVHHALSLVTKKVAVIVRTAFLEGRGRYERLYSVTPPARIWQFAPRISMPPGGVDVPAKGGSVAYCWVVWDKDDNGRTEFGWLN